MAEVSAAPTRLRRLASTGQFRLLVAFVTVELLFVSLYFALGSSHPTSIRHVLLPLVWITVGVWAVVRTKPGPASPRARAFALAVASLYFLVVIAIAGLVGLSTSGSASPFADLRVVWASPGWGPMVAYTGETFRAAFVPYLVVGYLSLSYLVYATLVDVAEAALSGVLGLFSCVGCSFPLLASLVSGAAGGSTGVTEAIYSFSLELSTAVFVLAVALLYWRPGFGR